MALDKIDRNYFRKKIRFIQGLNSIIAKIETMGLTLLRILMPFSKGF